MENVEPTYGWFKNENILQLVLPIIILIHNHELQLDIKTRTIVINLLQTACDNPNAPTFNFTLSTDFLNAILKQGSQPAPIRQQQSESEAAAERQRLEDEAAAIRRQQAELEAAAEAAARHYIMDPPQVSIDVDRLKSISQLFNNEQSRLFQKLKELLFLSQNNITDEIIEYIYTIGYLQHIQGIISIGGAVFNQLTQQTKKGPNNNDNQIQAKIAEIKQMQATMADTFADWRNEVYKIYTNPNVEERNAFYQEQTPFTILTHLMVCGGLFGPLKAGSMYIDVKEEDNLNSIADAFLTINNGYLSMSNVKTQLMIEDAKKASVSVPVNEKVEVQLEGPTVEVSQPGKPLTGSMLDTREKIPGFGGNKKYSRRKGRRHSKRQKKRCRRKSNKRFYSKKRYSKKRRK